MAWSDPSHYSTHCNHYDITAPFTNHFCSFRLPYLRLLYLQKIYFFIICFYAIMHRSTIVQNKIISIVCYFIFFCPANIYRPCLGKVRLGRPNPKLIQLLNFYLGRKKKPILLRIECTTKD